MVWLLRTADVCGLNVDCGSRKQKLELVVGTHDAKQADWK